jgi:maltooligosyltrehalose trehalohydrolase
MEQTLGAIPLGSDRCRFHVWAPLHQHVELHLLTPHDRRVRLEPQPRGYHEAVVDGVPPGSRYLYRCSTHGRERPDPVSRLQPQGVHTASEVVAPLPPRSDWARVPLRDYVIYEVHVGTFTAEGTFDAAIPRLDELKSLGITAVEMMPVAQFPGGRNWGYDGVYPFAVQNTYGGPAGLRRLIDACHERGLAVVLDVVYNHIGPEGNYLAEYAPYFTQRYRTDWGEALNYDGPHSDEVRRYFLENAFYWLRDMRIDALRLDATNHIQDHSACHFLEELARAVHESGLPCYLIAEDLANDPRVIRSRDRFGYGLDAQWCDDFHHALHVLLTGERGGYYEDFGDMEHLARAYRQGYHLTGQFCAYRQKRFGREPLHTRADQFVVYAQNHDQVGNRMRGERLSRLVSFEALKLAAGALLLGPNIPLLFMGEEYGEEAPFPFFISHSDGRLIEAVRRGRRADFAKFHWQGDIPDPQAEATFHSAKLHWERRGQGHHAVLREFYRTLLQLRRERPALRNLSKDHLETLVDGRVVLLRRWCDEEQALIVLNLSSETGRVTLPAGTWRKLLDSAETRWQGPGGGVGESLTSGSDVALSSWQVILLAC